jgi:hypothetical protein
MGWLATVGHLGVLYLGLLLLVVGVAVAYSGLGKEEEVSVGKRFLSVSY